MSIRKITAAVIAVLALASCEDRYPTQITDTTVEPAQLMPVTRIGVTLESLPAPTQPLDVAVYDFPDLTGAFATNNEFAESSRAVTQGGAHLLVDVLASTGGGNWFEVSERTGVENLFNERQIIERTQTAFTGSSNLPALRFAGILLEGAIIGYDTNSMTGGVGARFLGIGGSTEYREDVVTVSLRAVSVSNGRVLTSVTTTKTVYSMLVTGGLFRFVSVDEILEYETGYSRNEPEIFAVREAMELAVLSMILEGAEDGQWAFADPAAGQQIAQAYANGLERTRRGLPPVEPSLIPTDQTTVP